MTRFTPKKWRQYLRGCPHGGPLTEHEWKQRFNALYKARRGE